MMRGKLWHFVSTLMRAATFIALVGGGVATLRPPLARLAIRAVDRVTPGFLVPLARDFINHAVLLGLLAILTFAMSGFRRDALAESGLPFSRQGGRLLLGGIGLGIIGMAVVVGAIAALGGYAILGWAYGLAAGCAIATGCAMTYLLVGMGEELWFRGFPLAVLSRQIGFWPAAAILSLAFGFAHGFNPGEDWSSELQISAAGLALCLLRRLTGSLWFGIGAHAGFDYAESVIFSGPDSGVDVAAQHLLLVRTHGPDWMTGGSPGYENSLPGTAMGLLLILLPVLWFRHRKVPT
jgi:membrane protease YdiL (CAAX protease family)